MDILSQSNRSDYDQLLHYGIGNFFVRRSWWNEGLFINVGLITWHNYYINSDLKNSLVYLHLGKYRWFPFNLVRPIFSSLIFLIKIFQNSVILLIFSPFYIEYIIYILMASRGRLDVALYINDQFAENSLSNALQYLRVCYFNKFIESKLSHQFLKNSTDFTLTEIVPTVAIHGKRSPHWSDREWIYGGEYFIRKFIIRKTRYSIILSWLFQELTFLIFMFVLTNIFFGSVIWLIEEDDNPVIIGPDGRNEKVKNKNQWLFWQFFHIYKQNLKQKFLC